MSFETEEPLLTRIHSGRRGSMIFPPQEPDAAAEHRRQVRSLLAVIRATVQRGSASASSVQDYVAHLSGRLDALARVQELIMRDPAALVDLRELLADEFLRQGIAAASVEVSNTPLLLRSPVAGALALAVHELTTNAIKFGDLEDSSRRITISWRGSAERPGWQVLEWRELPLPAGTVPATTSGFGFELIRHTLPYEIGASTSISVTLEGLLCRIHFAPRGPAL